MLIGLKMINCKEEKSRQLRLVSFALARIVGNSVERFFQ